jgi:WD40 repeat protein
VGTSSSTLYKIDPVLGGCVPLVTIPAGNIRAIAFSPSGTLFAAQKSGSLYKINLNTGEATLIGTATGVQYSSIAFNPGDGRLFASVSKFVGDGKDMICVVDTATADTTLIGLTGDGKSTPSITFNPLTWQLYGLKGTQSEVNKLITISTLNGSGTEIASLGISGLQTIFISSIIVGVEDEIIYVPTLYELHQNYPNPFNPSTVISYQLPVGGDVLLKIYDILGNEVATLVDEFKPAGRYEVEFSAGGGSAYGGNAYNFPSGVYFYQLKATPGGGQAGGYLETKKMILLK